MRCRLVLLLLLLKGATSIPTDLVAQSTSTSLAQVSQQAETYIEKSRGWKHGTADPPTPPGSTPSTDVVIHFWSSEKCLTAELRVNSKDYGMQPVPCRIKLAIDQSPSPLDARNRLSNFVNDTRDKNPSVINLGDKGYVWGGSHIVFIKGRFTFWLSGTLDLRIGDLLINRDFMEALGQDIAKTVNVNP